MFNVQCLQSTVNEPTNLYAKYSLGPFIKGQSTTIGNALRRVLLSNLQGLAIVGARITGKDHLKNGMNVKDSIYLANKLKKIGFDYVCVSSGGILPITNLKFYKGFRVPFTKIIKKNTSIITRTSGLITDVHQANKLLKNKSVDLIAMARTFINDPMWIYKAAKKIKNNKIIPSQYLRCF